MSNSEIFIIVEGQTEQTFVREVLAPEFSTKNIFLFAVLIGKPGHKGGNVRFSRVANDIGHLLKQRRNVFVSTMFDYFRIDPEWPGMADVQQLIKMGINLSAHDKADMIEKATLTKVGVTLNIVNPHQRFIPYIEMHEFEALLFSDPEILATITQINPAGINAIVKSFKNPEEINDDPEKAPSRQLLNLTKDYRKVAMGKAISEAIGIQKIRLKCPHFHAWLEKLEQLNG